MTHYFTNNLDLKSDPKELMIKIMGTNFLFTVDNGVFSKHGLDFGTRTLLENLPLEEICGEVLDFGCGYGPIGIFIAKKTKSEVDMIDINERSLKLAKENALKNKVTVNIFKSDIYEKVSKKYNYIISNPPIRVGKEILYKILFEAKEHLKENGKLWIVVNKGQGAKSVIKDLQKVYNVRVTAKNKGFYVICAQNN